MQTTGREISCISIQIPQRIIRFEQENLPTYRTYFSTIFNPTNVTSIVSNKLGAPGDILILYSSKAVHDIECRIEIFIKGRKPKIQVDAGARPPHQWRQVVDNPAHPVICPIDRTLSLSGVACKSNSVLHWCPAPQDQGTPGDSLNLGARSLILSRTNNPLRCRYVSPYQRLYYN